MKKVKQCNPVMNATQKSESAPLKQKLTKYSLIFFLDLENILKVNVLFMNNLHIMQRNNVNFWRKLKRHMDI